MSTVETIDTNRAEAIVIEAAEILVRDGIVMNRDGEQLTAPWGAK